MHAHRHLHPSLSDASTMGMIKISLQLCWDSSHSLLTIDCSTPSSHLDRNVYGDAGSILTFFNWREWKNWYDCKGYAALNRYMHTFPCVFMPLVSEKQSRQCFVSQFPLTWRVLGPAAVSATREGRTAPGIVPVLPGWAAARASSADPSSATGPVQLWISNHASKRHLHPWVYICSVFWTALSWKALLADKLARAGLVLSRTVPGVAAVGLWLSWGPASTTLGKNNTYDCKVARSMVKEHL